MSTLTQSRQYELPYGQRVVVRALRPGDAPNTQTVMAEAWEDTYVRRLGSITTDQRWQVTDPGNQSRVAWLAMRIGTEHTKLRLKQRGSLYLGAFTVDDAGVEIGQVGMMKLRPETVRHKGGPQRIVWIDEMDVLPTLTRLGIGRAMAHSALVGYATELNCSDIRLHVVQSNEQARRFYERQLSLQVTGETSLGEGMPDSMLRDEMGGTVAGALATLNNNNRWLAGAT